MKTSNKQRGDPHPFSWPKISSFLTLQALDLVTKHIEENKEWNVCEKIDGCNVCVSNQGWIASRNKIIGHIEYRLRPFQKRGPKRAKKTSCLKNIKNNLLIF